MSNNPPQQQKWTTTATATEIRTKWQHQPHKRNQETDSVFSVLSQTPYFQGTKAILIRNQKAETKKQQTKKQRCKGNPYLYRVFGVSRNPILKTIWEKKTRFPKTFCECDQKSAIFEKSFAISEKQ